ncbi:hypothetical protein T4D_16769 [Trichinella pseudospiralis]|uniref:Uncharacterized protein n=2 Tax=Trichinella pseudospiralis TaxID=6337 RepID=A0A0V1FWA0_TRIPS|nr:hypothetical protein T4D_16769 [Trichinella pseudospiralis]
MVEHINLHIIKYEEFVGKIPLKMQVLFLIDVVTATDNVILREHTIEIIERIVKYSASTNYKSQDFNSNYKQRRKIPQR